MGGQEGEGEREGRRGEESPTAGRRERRGRKVGGGRQAQAAVLYVCIRGLGEGGQQGGSSEKAKRVKAAPSHCTALHRYAT